MRFVWLEFAAFGPFSGQTLDLSPGEFGLHLIYGPNEAGKSSSLRAITDLLFGIPTRSSDGFLHPTQKLRIRALLRQRDGRELEVVRRKGRQNTLRQADDTTPIDESEWHQFLGSIDRNEFQSMFGIDHQRLRAGGEEIARAGSQLGEALFAGGAGIANLQTVQERLWSEGEQLLTIPGRAGELMTTLHAYKDQRRQVTDATVAVETWRRVDESLRVAREKQTELEAMLLERRRALHRAERIQAAISLIGRRRKALADRETVGDAPAVPPDLEVTSQAALFEATHAEQEIAAASVDITKIEEELQGFGNSIGLIGEAAAIESLRISLGGYRKALRDRPQLETSRQLCQNEAEDILRRMGRDPNLNQIDALRVPNDKLVRIQDLGNEYEALRERRQSAERDAQRIRRRVETAEQALAEIQVSNKADELRAVLREVRAAGDGEETRAVLQQAVLQETQDAQAELARLPLWSGSLESLEQLAVPGASTIERFGDELQLRRREASAVAGRLAEETQAAADCRRQLAQLELHEPVPDRELLADARAWRERGWQLVLLAWQRGDSGAEETAEFIRRYPAFSSLAEAYQQSVWEADRVADQLRSNADRVAHKVQLVAESRSREERIAGLQEQQQQCATAIAELMARWQELWVPLSIEPWPPGEMRDWLRQQQELAQRSRALRGKRNELKALEERIAAARARLGTVLHTVQGSLIPETVDLRTMLRTGLELCERLQDAEGKRQRILSSLATDRSDLDESSMRLGECDRALAAWNEQWAREMQRLGLESDATPTQANRFLVDLQQLFAKYQEAEQFRTRLDGIERDASLFEQEVRALAARLTPDLVEVPVDQAVTTLAARYQSELTASEARNALTRRRSEQERKRQRAQERLATCQAQLREMCHLAHCDDPRRLPDVARRSAQRRRWEEEIRSLESQLAELAGGTDWQAFAAEAEVEARDVDALAPKIVALQQGIESLEQEREQCIRRVEREEAENRRIDGSARAAELQAQCESLAARLDQQLHRVAVLRVASTVLHQGIERYREKNQGPILLRASQFFEQLTLGRFARLQAELGSDGERLLTGIRSGGGEGVTVSGMSEGTRDQLYLAIRLASLEHWLNQHEPLPFVVDDVLIHFDDARALAGLQALAELSRRTQVLFFTHHRHLVDLARQHLRAGDLFVSTLAPTTNDK